MKPLGLYLRELNSANSPGTWEWLLCQVSYTLRAPGGTP